MAIFEIKEGTLTHNCEKGQPSVIDLVSRNYVLDYLDGQQLKKTENGIQYCRYCGYGVLGILLEGASPTGSFKKEINLDLTPYTKKVK